MKLTYFKMIFLFHILVVAALLFYIGYKGNNLPKWFYNLLGGLAIIIIGYHVYRIYTRGLNEPFWNYFHILVVAPLFLYTAYKKTNTPKLIYNIFIALAGAALFINFYFLLTH